MYRIKSQMPLDKKRDLADIVIDNSQSFSHTERQVEQLVATIHQLYHSPLRSWAAMGFRILSVCIGLYLVYRMASSSGSSGGEKKVDR